jgi:hypothetical protein
MTAAGFILIGLAIRRGASEPFLPMAACLPGPIRYGNNEEE